MTPLLVHIVNILEGDAKCFNELSELIKILIDNRTVKCLGTFRVKASLLGEYNVGMPFEEVIYPIFAGLFVLRMEMLGADMDSSFTDGAGSRTKVLNPFVKDTFEGRRNELLGGMSLSSRLVDIEKASMKSAINNIKIAGSLSNIDPDAIALLTNKVAAALLE